MEKEKICLNTKRENVSKMGELILDALVLDKMCVREKM